MKAQVIKRQVLKGIPSASGIEVIGDSIYVIGDDSPYLFVLDHSFNLKDKVILSPDQSRFESKVPKKEKPDLEAIASFTVAGESMLLILGSGSYKNNRDKAFLVEPEENYQVKTLSFSPLYDLFRKTEMLRDRVLNIEAAVVLGDDLYLFHRGNIHGNNVIFKLELHPLLAYLQDIKNYHQPEFHIFPFRFEKVNSLVPGFSGATFITGSQEILFTASLEDTPNEWYDGAIFESIVGVIEEGMNGYKSTFILDSDIPYKGKVESISILKKINKKKIHALAVTDSDGKASEIMLLEITL